MKKAVKSSNANSEAPSKRKKKTENENPKGLGLFDHIKHIQRVQNPDYFNTLTDLDKKSFNPYMILRALSMNPDNLEPVSFLYRIFDKIPHLQFYKLIISLFPPETKYYPWIKGIKKHRYSDALTDLVVRKFEVSAIEATDYINVLDATPMGKKELHNIVRGFGHSDREIEKIMSENDE
jgi:hypothetical protein